MSRVRNSSFSRRSISTGSYPMLRTMRSSHSSVSEIGAEPAVFVEIERGELDGYELVDPERVFTAGVLVVLKAHVDLRPDTTGQQTIELANILIRDVDVSVPKFVTQPSKVNR